MRTEPTRPCFLSVFATVLFPSVMLDSPLASSPVSEAAPHAPSLVSGSINGLRSPIPLLKTGMVLKVQRLKEIWDDEKDKYVTMEDTQSNEPDKNEQNSDADYAFTLVRAYRRTELPYVFNTSAMIHIRSPFFLQAAREIMKGHRNVAWNAIPVKFPVETILALLPRFRAYRDAIPTLFKKEQPIIEHARQFQEHLDYTVEFLSLEYHNLLQELDSLLTEKRITWSLLWGLFITDTLVLSRCKVTGEPTLLRLSYTETELDTDTGKRWTDLICDYVDFAPEGLPGFSSIGIRIDQFEGAASVTDLAAFPLAYHTLDRAESLRQQLVARGRIYHELSISPSHVAYDGPAYRKDDEKDYYRQISIKSRIMIDRDMFDWHSPYVSPGTRCDLDGQPRTSRRSLQGDQLPRRIPTEDEFMLMPARLYGFCLADRIWLEFNVCYTSEIVWNKEPFEQLELPSGPKKTKDVIRALISSHRSKEASFNDFVEGKGVGLIINLHGPPGVGKTLTAEATSEVAQSPLYSVGGGDLGNDPEDVDRSLNRILTLGRTWKAIVLIDEADVFLQRRSDSAQDQLRNAMISIFLKQLEYYPGILILTTNRLNAFDEAVKSRIHVSIHYGELSREARERLWRAFLSKAALDVNTVDRGTMARLSAYEFNGREIKNIVKTATTYAESENRTLSQNDVLAVIEINKPSIVTPADRAVLSTDNAKQPSSFKIWASLLCICLLFLGISALILFTEVVPLPRLKL